MKYLVMVLCLVVSSMASAEVTYYSDGSFSQSYSNGSGGSTTYNSDGSWSQSSNNYGR